MQVTRYQMQNVMDCFSKKLSRVARSEKPSTPPKEPRAAEETPLASETNRQAALEKISREIFSKITGAEGAESLGEEPRGGAEEAAGPQAPGGGPLEARFIYDVIDSLQHRRRATLAEGDAQSLMRRLNQVQSGTPRHRTDSWI